MMPESRDPDPCEKPAYRVYTRKFDHIVRAGQLDDVLGPLSRAHADALAKAWDTFQHGLAGWRAKVHVAALDASARIRKRLNGEVLADTAVALLVDQSGSMRGQSMLLAAAAVDISQDFLSHLGVAVEVLGFTTVSWRGGRSRRRWSWRFRPPRPGRLCDLLHVIYREADDIRASTGSWSLWPMLRSDLPKENVDGEALEWAANRLRSRKERRKILVVLSDGAPVDDSTLLANDLGFLERHLWQVVGELERSNDIYLTAIGIGFDVSRYYRNVAVVQSPDDLGEVLVARLEESLLVAHGLASATQKQ